MRAFFIDDRHAQMVTRLVGNQSIKDEGKASDFVTNATDKLDLAHATLTTTGAPVLLKNINDYLTGGMLTLGAIAIGIMTLILLLLFKVRWRLLPAADRGGRCDLGVRYRRLHRDPADDRDDRRPPRDARDRDRLRDPDARASGGGSGDRARGASHPGDRPESRAGAARRHVRRDLRVRGTALRQSADAAAVRPVADRGRRRDLPEQHRGHARGAGYPRVQVADERPRLPGGPAGPARRMARLTLASGRGPARGRQPGRLRRGPRGREQAGVADRPDPVGEPEVAGDQGPARARQADGLVQRARRVRRVEAHVRRQDGHVPR